MSAKSLKEIAEKLNISRFTVSRVMRNEKYVSEKNRKLVLDYLKKEPYFPNAHSKMLFYGKVPVVGLVFPGEASVMLEFYAQEIIKGVSQAVKEKNLHLMLVTQDNFNHQECFKLFKSKIVGGFIFPGIGKNNFSDIRALKKENVPLVLLCSHLKTIASYDCDNATGGYIATAYMIKKGYKKIAFLHGHRNWVDASDRCKGYKKALAEYNIRTNPDYIKYNQEKTNLGFEQRAIDELMKLEKKPDAIFAANDRIAIGAIKVLKSIRKKIPKDIAVMGFDNMPTRESFSPSLSTVEQPIQVMAYEAAKELSKLISEGNGAGSTHLFKPTLIKRKSA
jgi:DNA-binding LacI/PurR family transcriptional regulator